MSFLLSEQIRDVLFFVPGQKSNPVFLALCEILIDSPISLLGAHEGDSSRVKIAFCPCGWLVTVFDLLY